MDNYVLDIKTQISELYSKLKKYQDGCLHTNVNKKAWVGGEFDNQYYYTLTCNNCGHTWIEEQSVYDRKSK